MSSKLEDTRRDCKAIRDTDTINRLRDEARAQATSHWPGMVQLLVDEGWYTEDQQGPLLRWGVHALYHNLYPHMDKIATTLQPIPDSILNTPPTKDDITNELRKQKGHCENPRIINKQYDRDTVRHYNELKILLPRDIFLPVPDIDSLPQSNSEFGFITPPELFT